MSDKKRLTWFCVLPRSHSPSYVLQRTLIVSLVLALLGVMFLDITPTLARQRATSAFQVQLTKSFFGAQALDAALVDPTHHPDRGRFTITNSSELWYSVRIFSSSDALKPVTTPPLNDLVSETMIDSGLIMPSGLIPLNPDLRLYQDVTLETHFTGPNQEVSIELNPFTPEAATLDIVRLVLLLIGQSDVAQEAGIFLRGAIKEIVQDFKNVQHLTDLVNDFIKFLNAAVSGESLLGPVSAVLNDLLHIAGDVSELGALALAVGKALGRHVDLTFFRIVLGIFDGAKYLTDLIRSFGAYLFLNGNYPTITLRTVDAPTTPTPPPTGGTLKTQTMVSADAAAMLFDLTTGPDGNVWFTYSDPPQIGRITPEGAVTVFPLAPGGSWPGSMIIGPDGNLWFPEYIPSQIGRITPTGDITEFPLPASGAAPSGMLVGPDGNLWFTEINPSRIGRMTMQGAFSEFSLPPIRNASGTADSSPYFSAGPLVVGPDGSLWFKEHNYDDPTHYPDQIVRMTLNGTLAQFSLAPDPVAGTWNDKIVVGPDGNLWFIDYSHDGIGRITPQGIIKEFALPVKQSGPGGLTVGPDGNLWFAESDSLKIGRVTVTGQISEFASVYCCPGPPTPGPDGNLWFTEPYAGRISRVTPEGAITEFALPSTDSHPSSLMLGPDGKFWFIEYTPGAKDSEGQVVYSPRLIARASP